MFKTTDEYISKNIRKKIILNVQVEGGFVYVEGSKKALSWLILVYANENFKDNFRIHPEGAGSAYFKKGSTHGLYIHNTDFDIIRKNKTKKKLKIEGEDKKKINQGMSIR
jgi:hypothetical protein